MEVDPQTLMLIGDLYLQKMSLQLRVTRLEQLLEEANADMAADDISS